MNSELQTYPAEPTVFHRFRIEYELNFFNLYMVDSRLKGISIESKNTRNGVRTDKL